MTFSKQNLFMCAFAMLEWRSASATGPEPEIKRPSHMQRKAEFHRKGIKALLASGAIREKIRTIKRNRGVGFNCNDEEEQTSTGFSCSNMDMLSFVTIAELGSESATKFSHYCGYEPGLDYINEVWGYESSTKKYAIAGLCDGTSFVDITNARKPIVLGFLEQAGKLPGGGWWRDIKVVNDIAYIGAEPQNSGIQIFDLKRLDFLPRPDEEGSEPLTRDEVPRLEADGHIDTIGASHNIIEFPEEGKVLVVGINDDTSACESDNGETVAILDVSVDPFDPSIDCLELGSILNLEDQPPYAKTNSHPGYVHDGQCFIYNGPDTKFTDTPMCIFFAETEIGIYDMMNRELISTFTYPGATYVHQGWVSTDFTTLYVNDEMDEECRSGLLLQCRGLRGGPDAYPITRIFNITSLENVGEPREFVNTKSHPSIDHNLYVKDNYIYSANYEAGARVYKIEEDKSLREVAHFDVSNDCNDIVNCNDPFGGTWTHYPYSDPSTTIASNGYYGLSVFRVRLDEKLGEAGLSTVQI